MMHKTQMLYLGHTGEAIQTTAMIVIPERFTPKSVEPGMMAVLRECEYSNAHNFNLLSLTRPLYCQGWKINAGTKKLFELLTDRLQRGLYLSADLFTQLKWYQPVLRRD